MLRTLKTIVALLLLALWPAATAHCSIVAATELFSEVCDFGCSHEAGRAPHADSCSIAENGDYVSAVSAIPAPAPSLTPLACLACIHARLLAAAEPSASPVFSRDNPDDWIPSWTFALRAAPPARAPSLT